MIFGTDALNSIFADKTAQTGDSQIDPRFARLPLTTPQETATPTTSAARQYSHRSFRFE